jgi:hypothetical protein
MSEDGNEKGENEADGNEKGENEADGDKAGEDEDVGHATQNVGKPPRKCNPKGYADKRTDCLSKNEVVGEKRKRPGK